MTLHYIPPLDHLSQFGLGLAGKKNPNSTQNTNENFLLTIAVRQCL